MNEALRDWVANVETTYYLIGTAAGPHPYPAMVRDFQSVIGNEVREQLMQAEGRLPDALVAAVGGGSNAIGLFHPFLDDREVAIYGVEAGGHGLDVENGHAASMTGGCARRAARQPHLSPAGCRRADAGGPLDLRRARLSRRRAGAFVAEGHRPRDLRAGDRRRGAQRLPALHQARRHHPGARAGARAGARDQARARRWTGTRSS